MKLNIFIFKCIIAVLAPAAVSVAFAGSFTDVFACADNKQVGTAANKAARSGDVLRICINSRFVYLSYLYEAHTEYSLYNMEKHPGMKSSWILSALVSPRLSFGTYSRALLRIMKDRIQAEVSPEKIVGDCEASKMGNKLQGSSYTAFLQLQGSHVDNTTRIFEDRTGTQLFSGFSCKALTIDLH